MPFSFLHLTSYSQRTLTIFDEKIVFESFFFVKLSIFHQFTRSHCKKGVELVQRGGNVVKIISGANNLSLNLAF